jgi:hypothetical protein
MKFTDISRKISPEWKALTPSQKDIYVGMWKEDAERYRKAYEALTDKEKKLYRRTRRNNRRWKHIKRPSGAYMFYVKDFHKKISTSNKGKSFEEVGCILGQNWRELDNDSRSKYVLLAAEDKTRYDNDIAEAKKKKMKGSGSVTMKYV